MLLRPARRAAVLGLLAACLTAAGFAAEPEPKVERARSATS